MFVVVRTFLFYFFLLTLTGLGLDLTPTSGTRDLEGFKIAVLTFKDDQQTVMWQPPSGWKMSSEEQKLVFRPPNLAQALFEIRALEIKPEETLPAGEALLAYARSFLPPSVQEVSFVKETKNPFMLGPAQSRELTYSYMELGHRVLTSIFLVEYSQKQRLVFSLTARENDFKTLRDAAVSSMFSWQWQ
jgi:hypothetical protein